MKDQEITSVDTRTVLRRAIELDDLTWDGDLDEPLDRQALAEIAAEVGVSPSAIAGAIAEAQAGALEQRSLLDRLIGPRLVSANRSIVTDDELARERLVEWLSVVHGLRPRIRPDGVVVAQKRRDIVGKVGSGVRRFQGFGGLSTANSVKGAAIGADEEDEDAESGVVCLVADVGSKRNDAIVGGSAVAVGVSAVVSMVAVVTGPAALMGIPVAAGVGTIFARRSHRVTIVRITESVDHAVDGVAQGETPPRPIGTIARRRRSDRSD